MLSMIDQKAMEMMEQGKTPCFVFLGIKAYSDFLRDMNTQMRYAMPITKDSGQQLTKLILTCGPVEVRIAKPYADFEEDLILLAEDEKELQDHAYKRWERQFYETFDEVINEGSFYRRSPSQN